MWWALDVVPGDTGRSFRTGVGAWEARLHRRKGCDRKKGAGIKGSWFRGCFRSQSTDTESAKRPPIRNGKRKGSSGRGPTRHDFERCEWRLPSHGRGAAEGVLRAIVCPSGGMASSLGEMITSSAASGASPSPSPAALRRERRSTRRRGVRSRSTSPCGADTIGERQRGGVGAVDDVVPWERGTGAG